jgi:hypothetical protein
MMYRLRGSNVDINALEGCNASGDVSLYPQSDGCCLCVNGRLKGLLLRYNCRKFRTATDGTSEKHRGPQRKVTGLQRYKTCSNDNGTWATQLQSKWKQEDRIAECRAFI